MFKQYKQRLYYQHASAIVQLYALLILFSDRIKLSGKKQPSGPKYITNEQKQNRTWYLKRGCSGIKVLVFRLHNFSAYLNYSRFSMLYLENYVDKQIPTLQSAIY